MKKYIFLLWAGLCSIGIHAQTTFTATVSKNKVSTSDRFQLTLTLANGGQPSGYKVPSMGDFYILGGPNQSTSISMFNGNTTQTVAYSYVLQAKHAGTFVIGSASIKSGGKDYSTDPVTITVTDQPVTNNSGNNSGNTSGNASSSTAEDYLKDNFFMKTEVSDYSILKGEQITVTHKLYVRYNGSILDFAVRGATKVPKFNGFYAKDVPLTQEPATFETINGVTFRVSVVKKTICTAQASGDLEIDPLVLDAIVQLRSTKKSNDPFDQFFQGFPDPFSNSYNNVVYSVVSPTAKIKVSELPPNPPSDFNGAVGKFSMSTELNATTTKTDEPLTYRIIINGDGNLSLFSAPQLNLPPGWETYEPKVNEGRSSKTYEYLLIPRSPGNFNIPSHTWSYYDPDKNQYITLSSQSYDVHVDAGANYSSSPVTQGVSKEEVELLNKDIRYISKDEPVFLNTDSHLMGSALFYGGIGLPFLLGIGLFIMSARRKELEGDIVAMRNRKATAIARKRLSKASAFAKKNESKAYYDETIRALWGYLSDKFNIPQSEMSKENIASILSKHQVSEETSTKLIDVLNTCEIALFAPQLVHGSLEDNYRTAVNLLTQLESEIKE